MSTPKARANQHPQTLPRARPSKFSGRRKDDIKPERKASVRKQSFDLDEVLFDGINDHDDESDLSDLTDDEQNGQRPSSSKASSRGRAADSDDTDDDTMAAKLLAAGDGESLLGSGESDAEHEDGEERYIIADAQKANERAKARADKLRAVEARRRDKQLRRHPQNGPDEGAEGDVEDEAAGGDDDELRSYSPKTAELLGLPVVRDELFEEQRGFNSDSEPSFSDFFASDHAQDEFDDDDQLTSFDEDEDDSDISDLEDALMGEPFLAHVGALAEQGLLGIGSSGAQAIGDAEQSISAITPVDASEARADIPLLVIEDLDGRLIYARAGDGEAVFGSDGEFEFVDSEDEDDTDDEVGASFNGQWPTQRWQPSEDGAADVDDGDTTDELPDEDMPFPRLLVGSVGPRGGRTSRRARAMAAQMRKLSPSGASKSNHTRTISNVTDASLSLTSPTTPNTDLELPLPGDLHSTAASQHAGPSGAADVSHALPSSSTTNALDLTLPNGASLSQTAAVGTLSTASISSDIRRHYQAAPTAFAAALPGGDPANRPAMGSFMPSSSKSIHRAVVDGSRKAASPFTSKHSLQRRGLAGRRRPRQSSFGSQSTLKRARRDSGSNLFGPGEDITSEPASSPETLKQAAPLPMDLDDVVDASMLWRSGDSSEGETADNNDSEVSDSTAGPSRRSVSKGSDANGVSDGFSLNSNAFSRWRKIPMGAFREQQQGMLSGAGSRQSGAPRHRNPSGAQQAFGGNFLLQRVSSHGGPRRADQSSPFRRNGNHGSSLHMVVPAAHSPSTTLGQAEIIVSPVLWPVHRRNRHNDDSYDEERLLRTPLAGRPGGSSSANGGEPSDNAGTSRKMTKREKRERKAQRAAVRRAARAEREQLRTELSQPEFVGEDADVAGSVGPTSTFNTAPSTPNVGTASAVPDYLSPSKGMGMPRLQITEASPRASPVPGQSASMSRGDESTPSHQQHSSTASSGQGQGHWTSTSPSSSSLSAGAPLPAMSISGNTPPTHAVAAGENSSIPSLPSATFGPSLASPLFGGLFAPLSNEQDDLDREGLEGPSLRI